MADESTGIVQKAELVDAGESSRIRDLKAGSEDAFDWLIAQYATRVFRLAFRILNDHADASDAVQEVFLKVFRGIGEFQEESSLKTWIFRITVNTASNQNRWWRRHKERERSLDAEDPATGLAQYEPPDQGCNPFDTLLSHETEELVRKALARLPECSRTVLVLREMEGLSYEEVADILHLSLGTVKSRLARARLALKKELESVLDRAPAAVPVWNAAETAE